MQRTELQPVIAIFVFNPSGYTPILTILQHFLVAQRVTTGADARWSRRNIFNIFGDLVVVIVTDIRQPHHCYRLFGQSVPALQSLLAAQAQHRLSGL